MSTCNTVYLYLGVIMFKDVFEAKDVLINFRVPVWFLKEIKKRSEIKKIPLSKFIRSAILESMEKEDKKRK